MADVITLINLASTAMSFFGASQKSDAQAEEAAAKQRYYNSLATAEEKKGVQDVFQIGREDYKITQGEKAVSGEQQIMAAAAGYTGQSLSDLQQSTLSNLSIDKAILQQAAAQALQTSQQKAQQYRMAGNEAIKQGQIGQELTWLDTAQSVASRWIPKGGQ